MDGVPTASRSGGHGVVTTLPERAEDRHDSGLGFGASLVPFGSDVLAHDLRRANLPFRKPVLSEGKSKRPRKVNTPVKCRPIRFTQRSVPLLPGLFERIMQGCRIQGAHTLRRHDPSCNSWLSECKINGIRLKAC